ncbi:hypothetical protein JOB18_027495 [Solea senegalensis]|uniref:Protein shisa-5 n=1 Tax=Solea senegalensis TaxID=28829 RepID=A0AAV6QMI3_SOLSE|nr:protein shisa-4-like [Solea senegalensis]KAG7494286.1 hypothetical protein JOB18_027495 [Solea senegalensis]
MAVMVSTVLSSLVCILSVILLLPVRADHCSSYLDKDGVYRDIEKCDSYCCGDCSKKYCCSTKEKHLTQEQQEACHESVFSPRSAKGINTIGIIVVSIISTILPLLCVIIITCCLCPCCLIYQKCRKRRNQQQQIVINTTHVSNVPGQPVSPQHPSYPDYQPVPVVHGYGGPPMPTAPPHLYMDSTHPPSFPLHPLQPAGLSYPPPPPYSDDLAQPPYNPSHVPNP